jgi:hypothetical protein
MPFVLAERAAVAALSGRGILIATTMPSAAQYAAYPPRNSKT